ncbi:MAG TPA: histidine phosphatase family protein [Blastocatellia bacterium]|nr:histidine phosphatase family protein [Blastocatellia bacterium]
MGSLILARHGQATFLAEDYDRLSPLGETQSRLLGMYWAEQQITFDAVFSGPRVRQVRTAEIAAKAYGEQSGKLWPATTIVNELDEYDGTAVMDKVLPRLIEVDPEARLLVERYEQSRGTSEERKGFQLLFEAVMQAWISGAVVPPGVEPWSAFVERVRNGISRLIKGNGGGRRLVAFTSGGPISVAMQMALGVSDQKAVELNWQVRNASLTQFLFSKSRFTLDSFNALPHLKDQTTWSYR